MSESWIRPTSEIVSHSLLLRTTRNCPWGLCKFCECYKKKEFEYRSVDEIKHDIDMAREILDQIKILTKKLGKSRVDVELSRLYNKPSTELGQDELENLYSSRIVFNWYCSGARSVFLQDADSLTMHTDDLIEVLEYLKQTFPSINRISTYTRARTLVEGKTLGDLKDLHEAGLSRCHVGLESGDDQVLKRINKGINSVGHIIGGRKAKKACLELAEYVMPGICGRDRLEEHAKRTALVLNKIRPNFIMFRPYVPRKNTPLFEEYKKGNFQLTSPHERLRELKILINDLDTKTRVCFDQPVMNSWYTSPDHNQHLFKWDPEGYKFPDEKEKILKLIKKGLTLDESAHIHAKDLIKQHF
ncbi:hypothetical protein AKJ45_03560 [candidate division MSBL1 archaeon SCGC-AAA261F19]|uniref:Radical SAM core domain-containing protein n=1 Tax=candidate division MSBL1 archaeon SCGC-AAA261F19 TaxID=1698275 RepID=A0A133V7F2_9EURY|nr:hypothetical protein AKJ45_03560 [candidate division MSBL1 archaeon SCGC-AAA261F19]